MQKANGPCRALDQPPGANQEVNWILKKRRSITFNGMTRKLEDPTDYKKRQRPTPLKKEKRPRDRNQRNPDRMAKLIQRVLML